MGKYLEKAKELRAITDVHYNCAQSVICAFEELTGLDDATSRKIGVNFGSGMKRGGTCGAITGGLMTLGLLGIEDGPTIAAFHKAFLDHHQNCLDCADLLRMNQASGGEKKPHCDGMVFEAVQLIEDILDKRNK